MQFDIECFENVDAFSKRAPVIWEEPEQFRPFLSALRRVHTFTVEAESAVDAAQAGFEIGNAPWAPTDLNGQGWDHSRVRSMSSGDVVVVHTPDGPVAYGCLFWWWKVLPPDMLPAGVTA